MITLRELSTFAHNKEQFRDLLVRNQYYMPDAKSKASTLYWMYDIYRGQAWCPKQHEINSKQLANPPRKDVLVRIFKSVVERALTGMAQTHRHLQKPMKTTVEHIESHPADVSWLVNIIGLVDPQNEIFEKGYLPPKKEKPKAQEVSIEAVTGFFDGLPIKMGGGPQLRLPKQQDVAQ